MLKIFHQFYFLWRRRRIKWWKVREEESDQTIEINFSRFKKKELVSTYLHASVTIQAQNYAQDETWEFGWSWRIFVNCLANNNSLWKRLIIHFIYYLQVLLLFGLAYLDNVIFQIINSTWSANLSNHQVPKLIH